MMSAIKRKLLTQTSRAVVTNSLRQYTVQALTANDKNGDYYQKIGYKAVEDHLDTKPEGWENAKPFSDIPGPKAWPLIGNVWRFLPGGEYYRIQLIDLHRSLKKTYGNVAYLSGIPGKRPVLCCYDPEDIEQALRNEGPWPIRHGLPSFVYYRNHVRQDVFQGVGGTLTVQGEEWFRVRSLVNKILMQPRTTELYVGSMDLVADGLINNISTLMAKGVNNEMPENFQNELYKWALESMGVIAFNKRLGCLDANGTDEGQKLIDYAGEMFELIYKLDVLPSLWTIMSTKNWRRYITILDYMTETGQKYIKECLATSNPDPTIPEYERSVLERLVKTDEKVALAMTIDMLIAGIDTTGRTLGSALYFLAKHPNKQEALRQELKTFLPSKSSSVTKDMLNQSQYLKAVIKETTRLSPASVATLRTTVKDTILSGYQVPKGVDVLAVNIIPSLDEAHFIKAKEFIPDRWLRSTEGELSYKNVHPFVHLPFGFGPRSCIGRRLANLELEVAIAKIVRNFRMSWNYPDAKFGTHLLYGILDPLKIHFKHVKD